MGGYIGGRSLEKVAGTDFELDADLVLLAMGFVGPVRRGMIDQSSVTLDPRGNVAADTIRYQSSDERVFASAEALNHQIAEDVRQARCHF